jgi:hypothetical protein
MPSITSWMRLEPRNRNAEMNTSLQARIYDPLWLLARQWQFGEFQGEDNGSPVMARWRGERAPVNHYYPGVIQPHKSGLRYDAGVAPLETVVERERIVSKQISKTEKLRLAAETGQQFLRMLDQMLDQQAVSLDYGPAFIRQYPFPELGVDDVAAESLAFFKLMAGRVPDGRRMYAEFLSSGANSILIPPALKIAPTDLAEVREAARLWIQWCDSFFSEPDASDASWNPERMEYAFSVGTRFKDGECVLSAPEYYEGHLDWYAFDFNPASIGVGPENVSEEITRTAMPAPVSFGGMPASRFWEFEDAQVDFGSVDAGPTDLLRMLLVEFALAYGNDWFVIPVELEVGSFCQTRSVVISDTFGVRTLIKSSSEANSSWRMFQQSALNGGSAPSKPNLFFLSPALLKSLESRPIEEVLFLRDEMANMAWGVERIVESASEQPLNRYEQTPAASPLKPADGKLIYKLESEVPDYWIPLLPVKNGAGLRLVRGKVPGRDGFVGARGRILNPEPPAPRSLKIFEEEIPREGIRVTRHYQLARWHDGSTHLWLGRRKRVGSGEGSSGLRFDQLLE